MDSKLYKCLAAGRAPFAGETLHPQEMLPLPKLRSALQRITSVLESFACEDTLTRIADRHEADGTLQDGQQTTWQDLRSKLESDEALFAERSGEILVSVGVYPESGRFYLRTYLAEEDEDRPGQWGDFDVSGDSGMIDQIAEARGDSAGDMHRDATPLYFERRYAGD